MLRYFAEKISASYLSCNVGMVMLPYYVEYIWNSSLKWEEDDICEGTIGEQDFKSILDIFWWLLKLILI